MTLLKVAGVDEGSFRAFLSKNEDKIQYTPLCVTLLQGSRILSVSISGIQVDGMDVTEKLLNSLKENETNVVIIDGITFAGFNILDVDLLYQETGIPIIVFTDKKPNTKAMKMALMKHFPDWKLRWDLVEKRGELNSIIIHGENPVYFEFVGCSEDWAERVLREQCVNSKVPEAVRVAKMIAKSISPFF